jgi:hypothetical protein
VLALAAAHAWADISTLSLKAVAINGKAMEPTSQVSAEPGDIIRCEVYADCLWEDRNIRGWQLQVDGREFGVGLPIMPAYWDMNCPDWPCHDGLGCPPGYVCMPSDGCCIGPDHHPEDGAYIDSLRPDYVFGACGSPPPEYAAVDLSTLSFRYASTLLQSCLIPYCVPPPKYLATCTLEILPAACGTFPVGLKGGDSSFFLRSDSQVIYPALHGLEIDVARCAGSPVAIDPLNCVVDARQPTELDGSAAAGWGSMTLTFGDAPMFDPCSVTVDDLGVREVPGGGLTTLEIADVTCNDDMFTVHLNRRILPGQWTCIRYFPTRAEFCMAHLPGDVNGDGTSAPSDILRLIDCLNGVASCEQWQCDIDWSGVCGPPDVLRVIDLLNGAGVYEPWLNRGLPPCPSAP